MYRPSGCVRQNCTNASISIYTPDLLYYPMTRQGTTRILYYGILGCRSSQCRDLPSIAMSILLLLLVMSTMVP